MPLRIQLAQISSLVGQIEQNAQQIISLSHQAKSNKADCLVFPELFLTGYPPEDLLLRDDFIKQNERFLAHIAAQSANIAIIIGAIIKNNHKCYNAAVLIENNQISGYYAKQSLPNYGVFDEKRYFSKGKKPFLFSLKNTNIALTICEDIWQEEPIAQACQMGAELIITLNASPFEVDKPSKRHRIISKHAKKHHIPCIYLNTVGGQDEIVFDGGSFMTDATGEVIHQLPFFTQQSSVITDIKHSSLPEPNQAIYNALVLATKDYVSNNGFNGALVALSGGIDSALTLTIAADALGSDNVEAVMMSSQYTSSLSIELAQEQVNKLNIVYHHIAIDQLMQGFERALTPVFQGLEPDTTEENIQARIRAVLLMAMSNKKGKIALTTGNKSEMAVGYATLYGDMAGGFAPLKDISKTLVYQLAHYRNNISPVIPTAVINRAPSAELKENQLDQDSLPPYETLDQILHLFIEQRLSLKEIVATGFTEETAKKIINMVLKNEYKRRQSAPGPKITINAFGKERRYPITSGYQG